MAPTILETVREQTVRFYEFGPFLVDAQKCVLLREGGVVALTPKAFEVLLVLVRHPGQVLEKERLLTEVWPDTIVDENNLARNVSALRKALGEAPAEHQYVVTVPGRGYRFVASVREVAPEPEPVSAPAPTPPPRAAGSTVAPLTEVLRAAALAPPAPRRAVRIEILAAGIVILLLLSMAGLLHWTAKKAEPRNPPQRRLWQLTFDPGLESEPTWSRDGHLIAYSSDKGGDFDVWVQPVGEGQSVRVTRSAAHDWQPDWSPDGTRLAFRSERDGGGLYVVPALGGEERKIADFGYRPRWSPDGSAILFYSSIVRDVSELPKVYVVSPGAVPREVQSELLAELASLRVAWHPDGRRISVWGRHRRAGWSFWTVPLAGGVPVRSEIDPSVVRPLEENAVTLADFLWSPSGEALYFEGLAQGVRNLWKIDVDPRTQRWTRGPERLTTGAGIETELGLSADGQKLAFTIRTERTRLWSMPFDPVAGRITGPGTPLTAAGMDAFFPDLSPDGRTLAFLAPRVRKDELRARSIADGRETALVPVGDFERSPPRWSPDGTLLAYRRSQAATTVGLPRQHALVTLPAAGGAEQLLTTPSPIFENAMDWSTDGEWILGNSERLSSGRFALCRFPTRAAPAAEKGMRVVTSHPDYNLWQARFSPDQRWISFIAINATDAAATTVYVVQQSGGPWTRLTEGQSWEDKPRWAPDGRTLYFMSNRSGFVNVWGVRFDPSRGAAVGEPFRVTALESPGQSIAPYATLMEMALGAERLVLPITEVSGGIWILDNVAP